MRILNFSGVYREREYTFPECAEYLDLSGIESTSCYCDEAAESEITCHFDQAKRAEKSLNFIDSGDYHYVTALHCAGLQERFNLLLLDNHPDMQEPAFGNILSCGGWVRKMLQENQNLNKVMIAGIDPSLAGETKGFPGRVTVLTREEKDIPGMIKSWLGSLREPLYVSIDKDVLAKGFASTDWDQGTMTLDTMKQVLESIKGTRILGVDICGELPANKCGGEEDFALNNRTNHVLLSLCENL